MQRVSLQKMIPPRVRRNRQLLVSVVEILLRKIEAVQLQHFGAHGRSRTVTSDRYVGFKSRLLPRLFVAQTDRAGLQIDSGAALLEVKLRALCFSSGNKRRVQLGSRNRIDNFARVLSVGLKSKLSRHGVDHPSPHWDDDLLQSRPQPRLCEPVNSPRRQSQINRTPGAPADAPYVRPALVIFNAKAPSRQKNRQQRTV